MTLLVTLAATLLGLLLFKLVTITLVESTANAGETLHAKAVWRDLETAIAFTRATRAELLAADATRRAS